MKSLDRKLLRDLVRLRAQVVSIAIVVASGLAAYLALGGNYASLALARDRHYRALRFGEVFASLERAPNDVRASLESLPELRTVATRVVLPASLVLEGLELPLRARVVSLDGPDDATLDAVALSCGRWPEQDGEALLLESFAARNALGPGARVDVVLRGVEHSFLVTGLATSPGEVFPMPIGELAPDPERFAVLWVRRPELAAAANMTGAFNDVSASLRDTNETTLNAAIASLDRVLAPYGGTGAYARARHPSHQVLEGELSQLRTISLFVPALFFGVATVLVQLVLTRLVQEQRGVIATLKALGYSNREVAFHFVKLAAVIASVGAILGLALGAFLGGELTALYAKFFRFPDLTFTLPREGTAPAVLLGMGSAVGGAIAAVRTIERLPPAQAMHGSTPARHRPSFVDWSVTRALVPVSVRMVLRDVLRRPLRTVLGVMTIASAVGLLVVGRWFGDATGTLMDVQFRRAMTEDIALTFERPVDVDELGSLRALPGILSVEPLAVCPARLHAGSRVRDVAVWGVVEGSARHLLDRDGRPVALPPSGVVLSDALAQALQAETGRVVELEWRDGDRGRAQAVVAGIAADLVGLQVYADPSYLHSLRREAPSAGMALVRVDPRDEGSLFARLRTLPRLASATRRMDLLARFERQTGEMMGTFTLVVSLFATTLAVGVVSNQVRVAYSLRERELATMRVLGFTEREAASVLLVELGAHVLTALPIGLAFGARMAFALAKTVDPERFRMPLGVSNATRAFAITLTLLAATASGLSARRRVARQNLLDVLKAGE